jgi:hypothetical protein
MGRHNATPQDMANDNLIVDDDNDTDEDDNEELSLQQCLRLLDVVVADYQRVLTFAVEHLGPHGERDERDAELAPLLIRGTQIALVATLRRLATRFEIH